MLYLGRNKKIPSNHDLRQNYLLKSINENTQTVITSVDTILFEDEFLKDVRIYKIENGELRN